jgi:hypothetical protein
MRIEWDDDAIRRMTNEIVEEQAGKLQDLLDRVFRLAPGKSVDWVKTVLAQEWRSEFDAEITDPELSEYAKTLAEGHRIKVQPEIKHWMQAAEFDRLASQVYTGIRDGALEAEATFDLASFLMGGGMASLAVRDARTLD